MSNLSFIYVWICIIVGVYATHVHIHRQKSFSKSKEFDNILILLHCVYIFCFGILSLTPVTLRINEIYDSYMCYMIG